MSLLDTATIVSPPRSRRWRAQSNYLASSLVPSDVSPAARDHRGARISGFSTWTGVASPHWASLLSNIGVPFLRLAFDCERFRLHVRRACRCPTPRLPADRSTTPQVVTSLHGCWHRRRKLWCSMWTALTHSLGQRKHPLDLASTAPPDIYQSERHRRREQAHSQTKRHGSLRWSALHMGPDVHNPGGHVSSHRRQRDRHISIGTTFGALAATFAGLGIGTLATKETARDRKWLESNFRSAFWLEVCAGAAAGY